MAKRKTEAVDETQVETFAQEVQHSANFDKVKRYYDSGLWNKKMVYNMVTHPANDPWITAEEYEEITGEPYAS